MGGLPSLPSSTSHCEACNGDANSMTVEVQSEADLAMSIAALDVSNHGPPALPSVPSAAQHQRSMASSAAGSAQVAGAVRAQFRGLQERAREQTRK